MAGAWGSQARDEGRRYDNFSFGWAISTGVVFLLPEPARSGLRAGPRRFLPRDGRDGRYYSVRPWHVGAVIAVVELATVGALIANSG